MVISRDALRATDHTRGPGEIRGFAPCELDRAEVETVREPMMNRSVVMIRLLTRAPYCCATTNRRRSQRAVLRRKEKLPETSSAGTSLGSLQNRERHNCSHCAYALDLVRSWCWELPLSDPVIWGNDMSDLVNATTTGTEPPINDILPRNLDERTSSHVQNLLYALTNAPIKDIGRGNTYPELRNISQIRINAILSPILYQIACNFSAAGRFGSVRFAMKSRIARKPCASPVSNPELSWTIR